jgi:hypothetical protein
VGRQEQPLDPQQGPVARFAYELRDLRRRAGSPPYRRLAARTHYSASTLAAAAAGQRLPSAAVLAAFVSACGGDPAEWEQRRIHAHDLSTSPPPPLMEAPPASPAPSASSSRSADSAPSTAIPALGSTASQWWVLGRLKGPAAVFVTTVMTLGALVSSDSVSPVGAPAADRTRDVPDPVVDVRLQDDGRWLRTGTDIPQRYRNLIIEAGTICDIPQVTPALVAAILEAESGFDPVLSDPAKDEYGIARWTPRVLRYYLPPSQQKTIPTPPFSPEDSIPAVGRMLCAIAPELEGVPGDPALNLAAGYRISTWRVQRQGTELQRIQPYLDRVRTNLERYHPPSRPS